MMIVYESISGFHMVRCVFSILINRFLTNWSTASNIYYDAVRLVGLAPFPSRCVLIWIRRPRAVAIISAVS